MRPVSLVLVFAACGGGGDGAVLSFTAPDGPGAASRIELVLASADTSSLTETRQRVRPGILMEEPVVYYRQRSSVDAIVDVVNLDGFEVRIEPDQAIVEDESLIPFALIYDEHDALVAIGTVNDGGAPMPVLIRPGTVASYDVAVVQLAPDSDAQGIAAGQGHAITCQGEGGAWRSGVVWKPAVDGPQIRLLLPDVSANADATDAMDRESDLDCDDHDAESDDCDDLRPAYHAGQTETCDGADTDCDGRPLELIEGCPVLATGMCVAPGVQLCADSPTAIGSVPGAGACMQSAACGCAMASDGSYPIGCKSCTFSWVPQNNGVDPCDPGVGKVHFDLCPAPGCTVEVVGADGPWEIKIGPQEIGPFSTKLAGITTGFFYLRAKYLSSTPFPTSADSLGGAYIAITGAQGGRASLMPIDLQRQDLPAANCVTTSSGNNFMQCTP